MATRSLLAAVMLITTANVSIAQMTAIERHRLIAHLEMTAGWLADEVAGLTPAQLAFRPGPESWSIMDVLDHLVVVGPIYWQDLQDAVAAGPRKRESISSDSDILWYGIDRSAREKAIPAEVPKGEVRSLSSALDAYRKAHARLLQYARTTTDDLRTRYVPRQGCDAYQWALLISTHEQRHIQQIREIKKHSSFPKR